MTKRMYTLGSLFDGSGGFPLAGSLCGINPVWASEVEPYPIAVTRSRFPDMLHLGDISKVNGAKIPPVDIITFGSPCQDLSVAGKRAGLKHEDNGDDETTRSGLFMEAVRIIKEMRSATDGRYPTFALWENVPGAFSSNKGEDFRTVLEELIKIVEPTATVPTMPKGGWPYADAYVGDGWSVAYRTFDAQYWGVPQRRRRIHLVADFRAERAAKILFERDGLRGYFAEGGTPWQGTAADFENGAGTADRKGKCYGIDHAITTGGNCTAQGSCVYEDIQATLKASGVHAVAYIAGFCPEQGAKTRGIGYEDERAPTLTGDHENRVTDYTAVVVEGCYWDGNQICGTLTANNAGGNQRMPDKENFNCVIALDRPAVDKVEPISLLGDTVAGTLMARDYKGIGRWDTLGSAVCIPTPARYIVRRLTPTECARLQGFADSWGHIDPKEDFTDDEYRFWLDVRNTHAAINGKAVKEYTKSQMLTWYNKLHTDSSEYKMWGNGIALPPALYCMQGILDALEGVQNGADKCIT